jgi:RNA polymerase sigma factor (sigma-70 family)
MTGQPPSPKARARIAVSTHWTELRLAAQVGNAAGNENPDAHSAFETFCRRYWAAVYSVIRARYPEELARDLTQEFFLSRIIEGDRLEQLNPELGRFRSWLYRTLQHFLIDKWKQRTARKHDERLNDELSDYATAPAALDVSEYERHYAHALADRAFDSLHRHWAPKFLRHGKTVDKVTLVAWLIDRDSQELTNVLGISADNARQTLHRLHGDLWRLLRAEVAQTIDEEAKLAPELQEVCRILRLTPPKDERA